MCVGGVGRGVCVGVCGVGYAVESVDQCLIFYVFIPAVFLRFVFIQM